MNFYYHYTDGMFKSINLEVIHQELLNMSTSKNVSQWAKAWVEKLNSCSNNQKTFLSNSSNAKCFNDFMDKNSPQLFNFGWEFKTETLLGFVNIDQIFLDFQHYDSSALQIPIDLLKSSHHFLWQPTADITVRSKYQNKPILAFPMIIGGVHIIIDGNHRVTKALAFNQPFIDVIFINREEFFKNPIYFPSDFDFIVCYLATVCHEITSKINWIDTDFIPQSFFPPELSYQNHFEDYWGLDAFRF